LKGITSIGRKLVKPRGDAFSALNLQRDDVMVLATDLDAEISRNTFLFKA
jgi:hypothetical protein